MIFTEGFDSLSSIVICKLRYDIFSKKLLRLQFGFFPVLMEDRKIKFIAEVLY